MRTLVVVAALVAAPWRAAAAPPQHFESAALTVTLPAGWRLAQGDPGTRLVPLKGAGRSFSLAPGRAVSFVDLEGRYLVVAQDPEPAGAAADARWAVRVAASGDRLEVVEEAPPCGLAAAAAQPPPGGQCLAGDGMLELVALVDPPILGHRYLLQFGHQKREEGVDTAPFRKIVQELRFR